MSANLNKHRTEIESAWRDVLDEKTETDWALFGYEGQTNDLVVVNTGDGGIDEMKDDLNSSKVMYAFCKVTDPKTSLRKYVLINWQGEGTPLMRKGVCANHIRDIANILRGFHVTINARTDEDVDSDLITEKVEKSTASSYSFDERLDLTKDGFQKLDPAYKRVEPRKEINPIERDKFWAEEEQQEKRRQQQELKRRQEEQLRLEKEQMEREAAEASKREQAVADTTTTTTTTEKRNDVKEDIRRLSQLRKVESIAPPETVDRSDELRKMRNKEAEELISKRTINARAIFEQNTSFGQLTSTRKLSNVADYRSSDMMSSQKSKNDYQYSVNSGSVNNVSAYDGEQYNSHQQTIVANVNNNELEIKSESNYASSVINSSENSGNQPETVQPINGDTNDDYNLKAEALYDYQAADETEISFDPGDLITHIEQIDPGWWQGFAPDGTYGLFPANYVQLL